MNQFIEQIKMPKGYGWLYFPIPFLLALVMIWNYAESQNIDIATQMNLLIEQIGRTPLFIISVLPLVIGFFILIFWVKVAHNQKIVSLTTARPKVDWKRILFSFFLWAAISSLMVLLQYFIEPETLQLNFKPEKFFLFAFFAILLLPFQIAFEEYLFRGYLMQGIGWATKSRIIPLVITSIMFGLMHLGNPEVDKMGNIIMVYYIGTGFFLGLITLMDEGLELALGFHASNNIIGALLVTADWTAFQTDSIFIDKAEPTAGLAIIAPVFVVFPILFYIFSKKYQWKTIPEKIIFNKVG